MCRVRRVAVSGTGPRCRPSPALPPVPLHPALLPSSRFISRHASGSCICVRPRAQAWPDYYIEFHDWRKPEACDSSSPTQSPRGCVPQVGGTIRQSTEQVGCEPSCSLWLCTALRLRTTLQGHVPLVGRVPLAARSLAVICLHLLCTALHLPRDLSTSARPSLSALPLARRQQPLSPPPPSSLGARSSMYCSARHPWNGLLSAPDHRHTNISLALTSQKFEE